MWHSPLLQSFVAIFQPQLQGRIRTRSAPSQYASVEPLEARVLLSGPTLEQTSSEYSVEFDSEETITVAEFTNDDGEQQLVYALGDNPVSADFISDFDASDSGVQEIILTGLNLDLKILSSHDGTTLQLDSVHTFGNSLDVSSDGDLNVLSDAVISTRSVYNENHEAGSSNASSGSITLSTDQSIDVRGQLYTHVIGTEYTAGDISLKTSDTANVADTGPDTREISFNDASLKGGDIQITAEKTNRKFGRQVVGVDTNTVNVSIVNSNFAGSSITVNVNAEDIIGFADGKYKMGGTMLTGGVIEGVYGTLFNRDSLQSGMGSALQWPTVTVFTRDATANLTVDGSTLTADDTITLASDALSESEVEVIQTKPYGGTGGVELAVGYGRAAGMATTWLKNGSEIHAGADISVTSTGTTKAKVNVRTMAPFTKDAVSATEASASPASAKMIAVAYADTDLTVNAQVDLGVTITSDSGDVKVTATGTPQNIPNASTRAYQDGLAGVTVSYGNDVTSIKATVDGTINALGSVSVEDETQLTLTPQNSAQITENTLPYEPALDWQRGELLSYEVTNFNGTEPIGGLNSGQDYFVVDVVNDALKLAHIMELDLELPPGANNNTTQSFAVVTPQIFSPVDAVDETLNQFTLPDHGYTQGQEVQYLASAPSTPAVLQFSPTDTLNDSTFAVDGHGLVTGQEVQYSVTGELPGDGGTASSPISGLQNQRNYYVIALTQNSFQLAQTLDEARTGAPLSLSNTSETATQGLIFDSVQGNPDDPDDPAPAPIDGLFDQQKYYVILLDEDTFSLASTPEDADSLDPIDLLDKGTGEHQAFAAVTRDVLFNPFNSAQFDPATNTFHVDTTGIETGTRLIYDVDTTFSDTQTVSRFHTFSPSPTPVEFDPTSQITLPATVLDLVNNVLILPNHGLSHGDSVTYRPQSEDTAPLATVDDDLNSGQTLYVIRVDADRIQLAADASSAALPNPTALVFQVPGEPATYTLTQDTNVVPFDPTSPVVVPVVDPVQNTILFSNPHYFVTGQRVTYSAPAGVNTAIGGLANDTDYYVIELSPYEIQLASSAEDALASDALDLTTVGLSSTHRLTASAIDAENDWIVTPHHGLETGQQVIYSSHDGTSAGNLTDGTTYYVVRLDQNRIRLADSPQNATAAVRETNPTVIHYRTLSSPGTGTLHSVESTSIVRSFDATRVTPIVDIGADTLNLSFDWSTGQKVNYQTSGGDSIGGLEDGQDYYVIVSDSDPHHIKLAQSTAAASAGTAIDLTSQGTLGNGYHLFRVIPGVELLTEDDPQVVFDPTQGITISAIEHTVRISGHGYSTGQELTYLAGNGTEIPGLVNGQAYYAIAVDADHFQVAATAQGAEDGQDIDIAPAGLGTQHGFEVSSTYRVNDAPIKGLNAGQAYYAVVDGPNALRLAEESWDAQLTAVIEYDTSDFVAGTEATLTAEETDAAGITVSTSVGSLKNQALAGAGLGGKPSFSDLLTKPELTTNLRAWKTSFGKPGDKVFGDQGGIDGQGLSSLAFAAALAVARADHTMVTTVNGELQTSANISITSTLKQNSKTVAKGSTSAGKGKKYSIAGGFAFGDFKNTVVTEIGDTAVIDAADTVTISSDLEYPRLKYPTVKDGVATSGNTSRKHPLNDITVFSKWIGPTSGLDSFLNVWANSVVFKPDSTKDDGGTDLYNQRAETAITGSVGLAFYENTSQAIVRGGAQINQKAERQNEQQQVTVSATSGMEIIALAGMFKVNFLKGLLTWNMGTAFSLFGNKAKGLGMGVSDVLVDSTTTTLALIESGAKIHTGTAAGGLKVTARETTHKKNVFAESGRESDGVGIGVSGAQSIQTSTTIAQVDQGTQITGGTLAVDSTGDARHLVISGSVVASDSLGIGASGSIADVDRQTGAFVGAVPADWSDRYLVYGDSATASTPTTGVIVPGQLDVTDILVDAENTGEVFNTSVVGAIPTFRLGVKPKPKESEGSLGSKPASGVEGDVAEDVEGKFDVSLAGDAAVNIITDTTLAQVDAAAFTKITTTASDISVISNNQTTFVAGAGAGAIASGKRSGSGVAVAGSIAWNQVNQSTDAVVTDSSQPQLNGQTPLNIQAAGNITIEATSGAPFTTDTDADASIWAISGSLGYAASGGVTFAGGLSASINELSGTTTATVDAVDLTATSGAVQINAENNHKITGDGGAVAIAREKADFDGEDGALAVGFGGSYAFNDLEYAVHALLDNKSDVLSTSLALTATDNAEIENVTIAGGIEEGRSETDAAVSGAGSTNQITRQVEAKIGSLDTDSASTARGTISVTESLTVQATDHSVIAALSGGVALSVNTKLKSTFDGTFGAAWSTNEITDQSYLRALLDGVTVIAPQAAINVEAESQGEIRAIAAQLGVLGSLGVGATVNVAGAISWNRIYGSTDAKIQNTVISSSGSVDVTAVTHNSIRSATIDIPLTLSTSFLNVGVGINVSKNELRSSSISAEITDSQVSSTGAVSVTASALGTVDAISANAQTTIGVSVEDGASINLNFAGIWSNNISRDTVTALITDTVISESSAVNVSARDETTFQSKGVGIQIEISVSDAASVNIGVLTQFASNDVANAVSSGIQSDSEVHATQEVSVTVDKAASLISDLFTISLGFAGSGGVAIDAAAATTVLDNSLGSDDDQSLTHAFIDSSTVQAGSVAVLANSSPLVYAKIWDIGVETAFSSSGAFAGFYGETKTVTTLADDVLATIRNNSDVTADSDNVNVTAELKLPEDRVLTFVPDTTMADNTFTIPNHGFETGQKVQYQNVYPRDVNDSQSAVSVTGLIDGANYYVIRIDPDSFQLAETSKQADNNNPIDVDAAGQTAAQAFTYINENPDDPDAPQASVYIDSHSVGVTASFSADFASGAVTVIRSDLVTTSESSVIAKVEDSDVTAVRDVTISSNDETTLFGIIYETSIAASVVAAAAAAPTADQTIKNHVEASITLSENATADHSVVTTSAVAGEGDISVLAASRTSANSQTTSWSGSAGLGFATTDSHTTTTIGGDVLAQVGGGTGAGQLQVESQHASVSVTAVFDGHADTVVHSGAVGEDLLSVDTARPNSTTSPKVSAIIDGNADVNADNTLTLKADAEGHARAESRQTSVSLGFAGAGLQMNTYATPDVTVRVGDVSPSDDNPATWETTTRTDVEGREKVELYARSTIDASAEATMNGGALLVTVLSPHVNAEVTPTILLDVGPSSTVTSSRGVIEIDALGGVDQGPRPTTFDALHQVNVNDNTIEFDDRHRLQTGDLVSYENSPSDTSDIAGLTSGREYHVIEFTDKKVQLGEHLESNQTSVNLEQDRLNFGRSAEFTAAPDLPAWDPTNDFDTVIYRQIGDDPIGGLTDGNSYLVNRVSDDEIMLIDASKDAQGNYLNIPDAPLAINGTSVSVTGDATSSTTLTSTGPHGFMQGQAVTYRAADPVVFSSGFVNVTEAPDETLDADDPDYIIVTAEDTPSNSIYLGDDAGRFENGEVVEYRAAASNGQWYWTEGPAKPANDDQEDDSTQSADLHDLSGTQFWSGGSAETGGQVISQSYVNWATSQPVVPNAGEPDTKHFVQISDGGTWSNADGDARVEYYVRENPQFVLHTGVSKNWDSARSFAIEKGGWLPSITSEDEWQRAVTAAAGNTVWLGGSDDADEDTWKWVTAAADPENGIQFWDGGKNGSPTENFQPPWNDGEPNDGGSFTAVRNKETALEMYGSGKWNDKDDGNRNAVLVEMPQYTVVYRQSGFTFDEARADAKQKDGWIATVGSESDNDKVTDLLRKAKAEHTPASDEDSVSAWLGGSDSQVIAGLKSGDRYWLKADPNTDGQHDNTIQLYTLNSAETGPSGSIALTIDGTGVASGINHYLLPIRELPLQNPDANQNDDDIWVGIESGRTYYAITHADPTQFSLALTPERAASGDAISVSGVDPLSPEVRTIGEGSYIGTMGIDFTDVGQGEHNFVFDLQQTSFGTQSLPLIHLGPRTAPDGTGTASSHVHTAGGSLVAQSVRPRSTSTTNPDVTINLATGSRLESSLDIDINAISAGNAKSKAEGYGGALLASGAGSASTVNIDHSAAIYLYGTMISNDSLTIESKISDDVQAHTETKSFGAYDANALSNTTINQAFFSGITVADGAKLVAGDNIELNAYTDIDDQLTATTNSGALFGSSKANQSDGTGIQITPSDTNLNQTLVSVSDAHLVARNVALRSEVRGIDTSPDNPDDDIVKGFGGGMQNANKATGLVNVNETAWVDIGDGTKITSEQVEILALHNNLNLYTHGATKRGRATSKANAEIDYTGTSKITSSEDATLLTDVLQIQALQSIEESNFVAQATTKRGNNNTENQTLAANREIDWHATVLGRGRAKLEVEADGTIATADGVTLNGGSKAEGDRYLDGDTIQVDAVTYDFTEQLTTFEINSLPDLFGIYNQTGAQTVKGDALFYAHVHADLTNHSPHSMELPDIDLATFDLDNSLTEKSFYSQATRQAVDGHYTNWNTNTNEPNNSGGAENYLQMRASDGKWNDLPATSTLGYVFEGENGLEYVEGPFTFAEALQDAADKFGTMASVASKAENELIRGVAGENDIWLNGSDEQQEGNWVRPERPSVVIVDAPTDSSGSLTIRRQPNADEQVGGRLMASNLWTGGPAVVFDGYDTATSQVFQGVAESSISTVVSADADTPLSRVAVYSEMSAPGSVKFVVFDHSTRELLHVSEPVEFAADSAGDPTWKMSDRLSFTMQADVLYDIGAVSDVAVDWYYDTTVSSRDGITSRAQSRSVSGFDQPVADSQITSGREAAIRLLMPTVTAPDVFFDSHDTDARTPYFRPAGSSFATEVTVGGGQQTEELIYDSLDGSPSFSNRTAGSSVGTALSFDRDVTVSRFDVNNRLHTAGNMKLVIFDHDTHQLLFTSDPVAFSADSTSTWKTFSNQSFTFQTGRSYDVGAIADQTASWAYDSTPNTQNGVVSAGTNANFSNYQNPVMSGHGGAHGVVRLWEGSLSGNTVVNQLAVLNRFDEPGSLKFVVFEQPSQNLVYVSDPVPFQADTSGSASWKHSEQITLSLEVGKTYDIGAIADVAGEWYYDVVSNQDNNVSSGSSNLNFSNFDNPFAVNRGSVDAALRILVGGSIPLPPVLKLNGTINNPRGIVDLTNKLGSIEGSLPSQARTIINGHEVLIDAPRGAISTDSDASEILVRLHQRGGITPSLSAIAGRELTIDVQAQPDEADPDAAQQSSEAARVRGIDRLEGRVVDVGLMAWGDSILLDNPAGYWKLDDATPGGVAVEALGSGMQGSYPDNIVKNFSGAIKWDNDNTAAKFAGGTSSDALIIDDDPRLYGDKTQTVSGWFYVTSFDKEWQAIYFKGTAGLGADDPTDFGNNAEGTRNGDNRENVLWVNSAGLLHYNVSLDDGAGQHVVNSDEGAIKAGNWHHFATTVDTAAGTQSLYLDGQLLRSETISNTQSIHNTAGPWRLGNSPSGQSSFNGSLDDFAVFNKVLSADQILNQYTAGSSMDQFEVDSYYVISGFVGGGQAEARHREIRSHGDLTVRGLSVDGTLAGNGSKVHIEANVEIGDLEEGRLTVVTNGDIRLSEGLDYVTTQVSGDFTFAEAFADAATSNRWMTTILNADDQHIAENVAAGSDNWIGATDVRAEGEWNWLDGRILATPFWAGTHRVGEVLNDRYVNWAPDEPNNAYGNENVAIMRADGTWIDVNGDAAADDIPDKEPYALAYVLETEFDHQFVSGTFTFADAWLDAYARGGWIATIDTVQEQQLVQSLANGQEIWLGASDAQQESVWERMEAADRDNLLWSGDGTTGTAVNDAYHQWNDVPNDSFPGEPNNDGGREHYAEIVSGGGWNDLPATSGGNSITRPYLAQEQRFKSSAQQMQVAQITSTHGSVTLAAPGEAIIEGSVSTGSGKTFTWNGTGQLLDDGPGETPSVVAGNFQLASTGGVGKPDQPLHANVSGLHGDYPLAGIHLYNAGALTVGNLTVVDDNLLVVSEGSVTIDGPLVADGGGNLSVVANGLSAVLHVQAPVRTSGGDGNINLVGSNGVELDTQLQYQAGTSTWDDFIRQAGPAGYWKLDESFGTVASEALGRDLDGVYSTNVTLNQSGAVRSGARNFSIDFPGNNGDGNTVTISDDTRLYGGKTQTVTGWLKVDSLAEEWQAIYFKGDAGAGSTDFSNDGNNRENVLWVNTSGYLHYNVALDDGLGQHFVNSPSGLIQAGQWYHFATVVDTAAGTQQLFVNGEQVGSETIPTTRSIHNTSGSWRLGNSPSGESSFNGALDDFVIFNKVLSDEEIKRQYLAGVNETGAVTFAEAQTLAEQQDGWLAVLHTEEIATAASTVVGSHSALAGGTDENHEGDWRWVTAPTVTDAGISFWRDNQTQNGLVQYWNADTGEPNGSTDENILEIESGTRKWNDLSSSNVRSGYLLQLPTVYSAGHGQIVINAGTQYRDGVLSAGSSNASITMNDGVSVTSEHGNLVLLAASDVLLSNLKTEADAQGSGGNVLVVADYDGVGGQAADGTGSIRDHLSGDLINIKADGVILSAEGEGSSSFGIGSVEQPLHTSIATLAATTDSGDIAVENHGDLTIGVVELQLNGLLADVLNWRDIVPISQLPARISDLVNSVDGGEVVLDPGQFLMGGLSILDSEKANTGNHDISVNSSDSLTVATGVPVVNLEGGSVTLSSLRDAEPNDPATFEVISGNFTWQEAQTNAAEKGGWLANITSAEVQDYINTNVISVTRSDITSPANAVTPSSQNSPTVEQSTSAIDNNDNTKYLNFDKLNAGLTITTAGGVVTGLTLTSANDAPERDPRSYKLEGSNNGGVSFDLISEGSIPAFTGRLSPQTVNFSNEDYYTTYRLTFPEVADAAAANSMQIAEVELLGVNRQYWTGGQNDRVLGSGLIFDSFESTSTSLSSRSAGNSLTTQITTAVDTLIGSTEVLNEISTGGFLKFVIFDNAQNLVFQTDPLAFAADPPGQSSWKRSPEFAFNLEAGATYHIGAISDRPAKWNYDVTPTSQNGISSVSRNANFSGFTSPQFYSSFFGADGGTRLYAPASTAETASIADGWNWVDADETVSFDRFGYTNWNPDNPGDDSQGRIALYADGKWADVPQTERMSYILQRPVPGDLNINAPVFSAGSQGEVFLYEGYRSLRIPVPLNESSGVSYYQLNVAGTLQEGGVIQLSLSANREASAAAGFAAMADVPASPVTSLKKPTKTSSSLVAATLQKDVLLSTRDFTFVADEAPTDLATAAPDDTAVGAGVRFFWNTDKQLRDAASYEDGTLLSDAEFQLPESGTRTFYLRVLYPGETYTDYQKTITIPDVAPENLQLQSQETPVAPGTEQILSGTFTDSGINDQHQVQIDWGDGSPVNDSVLLADIRSFEETHTYNAGGKYEATVTVTDTESGETTVSQTTFYVTGIGLADGVLNIVGTENKDKVRVRMGRGKIAVDARLHGVNRLRETFATADVERICFIGFSGDDIFVARGRDPIAMDVFGGAGDDVLTTGAGPDTITDLSGNNRIRSGSGNDQIMTGPGRDRVQSGSGDDSIRDAGGNNRIDSGSGADTVLTGNGDDRIRTGAGDDVVRSVGGDNVIRTGTGSDRIETGAGDDNVRSDSGNDEIIDLGGRNRLRPGRGLNTVSVISDDSRIDRRSRNDQLTIVQTDDLQPVKQSNDNPLTASFRWSDVSFADGFQIRVDKGDTQNEVLRTFTTDTDFSTPNDLLNGSYTFAIRPVRLIAEEFVIAGDWTEPVAFTIDSTDEELNRSEETSQGTNVAITVLTDTPAGDPSITSIVSDPANGTANMSEDGNLVYTPNNDFTGEDTFRYMLTGASGDRRTGTVTVQVTVAQVGATGDELPAVVDVTVTADDTSDSQPLHPKTLSAGVSDRTDIPSLFDFVTFNPDEVTGIRIKR